MNASSPVVQFQQDQYLKRKKHVLQSATPPTTPPKHNNHS